MSIRYEWEGASAHHMKSILGGGSCGGGGRASAHLIKSILGGGGGRGGGRASAHLIKYMLKGWGWSLVDLGGVSGTRPPCGTQFFHFCIHFHRKAPALEVDAPLTGRHSVQ